MESIKCPLCLSGTEEHATLHDIQRTIYKFRIVRCNLCHLVFMNPRYSTEERNLFYSKEYFSKKSEYSYIDERQQYDSREIVYQRRLKTIEKYFGSAGTLLEIGSSFGGFLDYCRKNDWLVTGLDISDAVQYCNEKKGLEVYCGDFEDFDFNGKKYDVIVLIEVIEHLGNPDLVFKKLSHLLNDNGLLVIQTNNIDNCYGKLKGGKYFYFMPGHLIYYSKKTISQFLKRYGMVIEKYYSHRELKLSEEIKYMFAIKELHEKWFLNRWINKLWVVLVNLVRRINIFGITLNITMVLYIKKRGKIDR